MGILIVFLISALGAALGAAPSAQAHRPPGIAYPPSSCAARVSTALVPQGGSLTVLGCGFAPQSPVSIDVLSSVVHLTTVRADRNGDVVAEVTLPKAIEEGPHTIRLTGENPDGTERVQKVGIEVCEDGHGAPPSPPAGTGGHEAGGLAGTGLSGTTFTVVAAGLLLSVGSLTLLLVRSRRRRARAS
ncbi:hypothetical protein [Kitasatospora sp. DSM 101779]|uniref:hypothetical protein n=1 Tax=Kitasatospora sp. DSM 101779 TaxID=2853165 RepID=UPI0021D94FC7|nr:hypothetical protein [Kitasatospora sp. DSM 101779]MCU7827158.1 hypothetical protein [Kitasatospora sp. DSM 101779]